MRQAPKMTDIVIEETSGVDHPAHMHEGWLVIKTAYTQDASEVQEALKEIDMPEDAATKADDEMMPEDESASDDLAMAMARVAELEARIAELEGMMDTEAAMEEQADKEASADDQVLALAKKANPEVAALLSSVIKAKADAETALMQEREARADDASVAKAAEMFKHLGLDPGMIGPALRRLDMHNAELAKAVTDALLAANAQNESANIFAEIGGHSSVSSDSYQKMVSLAKAAVAEGKASSVEQGIAMVASTNPALYNDYLAEKGA